MPGSLEEIRSFAGSPGGFAGGLTLVRLAHLDLRFVSLAAPVSSLAHLSSHTAAAGTWKQGRM